MSLRTISQRDRKIAEVVHELLSRDEWYTLNELTNRVGGDPIDAMLAFRHFRRDYSALRVRGPSDVVQTVLWHGDMGDPSTKRLLEEEDVDVWDLPFTLRKSFTAKYNEAHWKHPLERASWKLVQVATIVDEALAKNGLDTEHPRPTDGFPFQCVWRTNEPYVAGANFTVRVTFTGTIRTDDFKSYRGIYDKHQAPITFPGYRMTLKICQNFTTLDVPVGLATVNRYNKHLTHCPTRNDLIEMTRTTLLEHASRHGMVAPFTPILCGFSLLSGTGDGGKDE